MAKQFVRVVCNVYCEWEGLPPNYRVYINDELFTERTWNWAENFYLEESLQINADPGEYQIRYELVPPHLADLRVSKPMVTYGCGTVDDNGILRVTE